MSLGPALSVLSEQWSDRLLWIISWCHSRSLYRSTRRDPQGGRFVAMPDHINAIRTACKHGIEPTIGEWETCKEFVLGIRPETKLPEGDER